MYKLKTRAITTDRNGKEYVYNVILEDGRWDGEKSLVLRIVDTPGSWYLSTLFGKNGAKATRKVISIDMGQNWDCINMDSILGEVRELFGFRINPEDYSAINFSPAPKPSLAFDKLQPFTTPNFGVNENVQLIVGKGTCTLSRVENHAGDVYFRLRSETYQDGRRACFTLIEYSSADLARAEFNRLTGGI